MKKEDFLKQFKTVEELTNFLKELQKHDIEASYYISKKIGISVSTAIPLSGTFVYSESAYSGGVFFDLK